MRSMKRYWSRHLKGIKYQYGKEWWDKLSEENSTCTECGELTMKKDSLLCSSCSRKSRMKDLKVCTKCYDNILKNLKEQLCNKCLIRAKGRTQYYKEYYEKRKNDLDYMEKRRERALKYHHKHKKLLS